MRDQVPLIYFVGIARGWYTAAYPAYVVDDDPATLSVTVAVDEKVAALKSEARVAEEVVGVRRAYATQLTRRRMHQDVFRHKVLAAYRESCAVCRLKQRPLLQAAHIIADRDPRGVPEVFNGLSLCGLHHGAFDSQIIGIRPAAELIVEVRDDVLRAKDGPMLIHGIQECHGKPLAVVPSRDSQRPRREYLEERYEQFRKAI
jgi:putative restriction endonuclease